MASMQKDLERAFKLIKHDRIDEALEILRPAVQAEPNNAHAWWLLAYAARDPSEVREALIQVLRIDPHYTNAPKAREMLDKLNQEYPPTPQEIARFPELSAAAPALAADEDIFGDSAFAVESSFEELPELESSEQPFSDDFFAAAEAAVPGEDFFTPEEDLFAELPADTFAVDELVRVEEEPVKTKKERKAEEKERKVAAARRDDDLRAALFEPQTLDENALARREERAYARRGRGRRMLAGVGFLALIAVVAVVAFLAFLARENNDQDDPGALQAVANESEQVASIRGATDDLLQTQNFGGTSRAVVASSALGDTLYVEICGQPSPALPQLIQQAMQVAAQQAPAVQGQLKAIGVTVETCDSAARDTLYRAVVSVEDALRYVNGEIGWEAFQALWKRA